LYTVHPPGRQLRLLGNHLDGAALLLSLGLVPAQAGGERVQVHVDLPFRLESWGVTAATGMVVRLSCTCAAEQGGLLLRGRAHLRLETPGMHLLRTVHFSRFAAVDLNPHLRWRAVGWVEALDCRIAPDGVIEGRLQAVVACRGDAEASPPLVLPGRGFAVDGVAAVRRVSAGVAKLAAEYVSDGWALVSGMVEVDVAWADQSGRGRWTCLQTPFSAMLAIPGLEDGDRLEPTAQIDRISRMGHGPEERSFLLLALGLTALRPAHLPLEGSWYRVERVVGQAVCSLDLVQPLFPPGEVRSDPALLKAMPFELDLGGPWTALRARIRPGRDGRPPVLEVRGQPSCAGLHQEAVQGEAAVSGEPAVGGHEIALGLATLRDGKAEVRPRRLPPIGGVEISVPREDGGITEEWLDLPEPAWGILGVELVAGRQGWGLHCLVRCRSGLRLVWLWLQPPANQRTPIAVTVAGTAVRGVGMERLRAEVSWRAD
jgi:hypothetical protein